MRVARRCIVHVLGRDGGDALPALVRAAQAASAEGAEQVLIALDDRNRVEAEVIAPEVRSLPPASPFMAGRVRALQLELRDIARERTVQVIHLHGWDACVLGALAVDAQHQHVRILCSPHCSSLAPAWKTSLLGRLLRRRLARFDHAPLATSRLEAQALSRLLQRSAEVLPDTVAEAFFRAAREEDRRPGIVAAGSDLRAVDLVARMAVLMNGREPRVHFSWLGARSAAARAPLEAAQVQVVDAADDQEVAGTLARAWVFMGLQSAARAPALAEAMAAGVPCLVSDTPRHRDLIHHGETGFVCASERDFVEKAVLLMRDAGERREMGAAARAEARRRFSEREFRRVLLRAYGMAPAGAAAPAAGEARRIHAPA